MEDTNSDATNSAHKTPEEKSCNKQQESTDNQTKDKANTNSAGLRGNNDPERIHHTVTFSQQQNPSISFGIPTPYFHDFQSPFPMQESHYYSPAIPSIPFNIHSNSCGSPNDFQNLLSYPPHEILDDVMKRKTMRRNSLPFTCITATSDQPIAKILSASFSSTAAKELESLRLRNTHSLERDIRFGVAEAIGGRKEMEDKYSVVPFRKRNAEDSSDDSQPAKRRRQNAEINGWNRAVCSSLGTVASNETRGDKNTVELKNYAFFAVYDGHGGTACAEFARMNLHANIVNHPDFGVNIEKAITEGFQKTEKDFEDEKGDPGCGTTACVCLIFENVLYVANVGDSMGVMCKRGKPIELNTPHTLNTPSEKERVEKTGGVIIDDRLAHPVWNPRLINIGVTRALGDFYFKSEQFTSGKPSGLISTPEIRKVYLTDADRFIILATDGFWDVVKPQEAIDYVLQRFDVPATEICKNLTDLVATKAEHSNFDDNATVLLVKLKGDNCYSETAETSTVTPKVEVTESKSSTILEKPSNDNNFVKTKEVRTPVELDGETFKLSESNSSGKLELLNSRPEEQKLRA